MKTLEQLAEEALRNAEQASEADVEAFYREQCNLAEKGEASDDVVIVGGANDLLCQLNSDSTSSYPSLEEFGEKSFAIRVSYDPGGEHGKPHDGGPPSYTLDESSEFVA